MIYSYPAIGRILAMESRAPAAVEAYSQPDQAGQMPPKLHILPPAFSWEDIPYSKSHHQSQRLYYTNLLYYSMSALCAQADPGLGRLIGRKGCTLKPLHGTSASSLSPAVLPTTTQVARRRRGGTVAAGASSHGSRYWSSLGFGGRGHPCFGPTGGPPPSSQLLYPAASP